MNDIDTTFATLSVKGGASFLKYDWTVNRALATPHSITYEVQTYLMLISFDCAIHLEFRSIH